MLSKNQAKWFFLGGTLVTFAIFIGLTIYSLSKAQDQSHADQITAEVAHGKMVWEKNNCMGCHTIMGEGAYYAPELTNVINRRGEGYVKSVLTFKGNWGEDKSGRKMVNYSEILDEKDVNDLIAFFKWIQNVDMNGFEKVDRTISPLAKDHMKN